MFRKKLTIGLLLCLYWIQVDTARILAIFPTPSISHQVVYRPLTQELVKRGHEVIVITPDPAFPKGQAPANLTEIDVHDISYKHFHELRFHFKGEKADALSVILMFMKKHGTVLDLQLQTSESQEVLKKPRNYFDLVILEACSGAAVGINQIFHAPIVQISSFGTYSSHYSYLGAPMHPLLYPTPDRVRLYNLSRWEKIVEFSKYVLLEYIFSTLNDDIKIMRNHFGDNLQNDVYKNIKLLLLNEHPIWADNHPLPPNIHYIGGIHQIPEKELPKDLKSYLDASKNGVIYMSFGTNVMPSILPPETIEIMTRVFSKLPYDVLMKWDDDELPGQPPNVKIQKWLPQSDLLKHPKIKLFITQAGLQSTEEAINAAVPLLAIPMLGDQWYNAEKIVRHKIGLQLDFPTLNEIEFKKSIETILTDESFKNNSLRLRTLMREHPIKPLELAVWWTEHIIKFGGDHLIPPSAYLHWTEYYEVELIIICLSVVLAIMILLMYIIKVLLRILKKALLNSAKIKTK